MASPACPTPIAGCTDTRIQVLKDAVTLFYDRYNAYPASTTLDRTSLVTFSSALDLSLAPLVAFSTGRTTIPAFVNSGSFNASGLTAMGGGIQAAINQLQTMGGCNEKHVIVFTDGMQNQNPKVATGGGSISNDPSWTPAGGVLPGPYSTLNGALGIKVHTIGIGGSATDSYFQLLTDIANNTNGVAVPSPVLDGNMPVGGMDLADFYQDELLDVLKGNTPGLLTRRNKRLSGTTNTETFEVNKKVKRVVIELIYQRGGELSFNVEKDGKDLSRFGRVVNGNFYRFFIMDFPVRSDTTLRSEGEWKVTVRGQSGSPYKFAVVVDDHNLRYNSSIVRKQYQPGQPLDLFLKIDYQNRPVNDHTVVKAVVFGPNDKSLGTLMSTFTVKNKDRVRMTVSGTGTAATTVSNGDSLNAAQLKYQQLISDIDFYEALIPQSRIITLQNNGDGNYGGQYNDTEVPGPYRVHFLIDGNVDSIGHFVREEVKGTMVGFGHARENLSALNYFPASGSNLASISLRPRDKFKNYLGPDNGHNIRVTVEGQVLNRYIDNLDGSYTFPLSSLPRGGRSDVDISVNGGTLYDGNLSGINDHWGFGIAAGVTFPRKTLDSVYNSGPLFEASLTRTLSRTFSLEFVGGYYGFADDFSIYGGTAYLKIKLPRNSHNWALYAAAGGGIYKPENVDAVEGLSGRLGLSKALHDHLNLTFEGAYFRLEENDPIEFLGAMIGLRFTF
jgi:hypothetical protein